MLRKKQQGVILILFVMLLLTVAGSVFLLNSGLPDSELERKVITQKALSEAKKMLISFSVNYYYNNSVTSAPNYNPLGRLPFPDRNQDSGSANYDGESDCVTSGALANNHLIGRFPWLRGTCVNREINADLRDASNERLWYAVSSNLLRHVDNQLLGFTPETFFPASLPTNPLQDGWLTVYDLAGNILSNRVAFVVMAAGKPINGQVRNGAAPPADRYLDSFALPNGTVINNYDTTMDFVTAPENNTFNDQLVFVTIDEILALVAKRVLNEFKNLLKNYYFNSAPLPANRFYPKPAQLGDSAYNCDVTITTNSGFIATNQNTCIKAALFIPINQDYLNSWLPYIYYEVRSDCTEPLSCTKNQLSPTGFSIDGSSTDQDIVLMYTGGPIVTLQTNPISQNRAGTIPHAISQYLDDSQNITFDRNYITPKNSANNNDQITTL